MYPKSYFASAAPRQRTGKCFVIMPFADKYDEVYETIKEAIEGAELGMACARADDLQGGGHIIEDILRQIAEAEVVIADLTGKNPNVFYELGIVQMVKDVEKVLLLSQDIESIPFDVRVFRTILYQQSIRGARELREKLITGIRAVAEVSFRFVLESGQPYTLPQKVMGPDGCAYDISISDSFYAIDGTKFMLAINRFAAGQPPQELRKYGCGLAIGQREQLANLEWDLILESVVGQKASFAVQRRV